MKFPRIFTWRRVILMGFVGLILTFSLFLLYVRPLLPSGDYAVTATFKGQPIQVQLLKPLFMSDLYYIHLPDVVSLLEIPKEKPQYHPYEWIGFMPTRELLFTRNGRQTGPFGPSYLNPRMAIGIDLTFAKIEDDWEVKFSSTNVWCSNGILEISFTRKMR